MSNVNTCDLYAWDLVTDAVYHKTHTLRRRATQAVCYSWECNEALQARTTHYAGKIKHVRARAVDCPDCGSVLCWEVRQS